MNYESESNLIVKVKCFYFSDRTSDLSKLS
jgi:hypothetical protein